MAETITNVLGTVAIKHCGEYDSTMHYEKLNVVTYNGSSYCAKDNTIGNAPTNTTYWDIMSEKGDKGDKGDTPVKGTDYYTDADKAELESTLASDVSNEVSEQLSTLTSATPLVASSTTGMTDTTRIYVNTTDGHWYWYDTDSTQWTDGGVYQATGIDPADPVIEDLNDKFEEIRAKVESVQLYDYENIVKDKTLANTFGVSTPYDLVDSSGVDCSNVIIFDTPLTSNVDFSTNIIGFSRICTYKESSGNLVREGSYGNSSLVNDETYNNRKLTVAATTATPIKAIRFSYNASSNPNTQNLYFCKTADYYNNFDTYYKNYYELNDKLDVSHLISNNPINYNGNEVNLFYKGIAIGDSLTEGTFNVSGGGFVVHKQYAYPMYFYKKTGVTLRNFGVGGSTAQSWYERYQNVTFPVYDFAIIALGVNDILQSVSNETTITYINNIVNKLKSQNNDVKCFIATLNKAYKNQTGWDSLNTAIRNYVNNSANCYLLDIAKYGKTDVGTPYESGHLTALGYAELANEYANMISYIISKKPNAFKNIQFSGTQYTNLPTD